MNKFEQVSSDNHQMSLAGVGISRSGEPREGGYVWGWTQGEEVGVGCLGVGWICLGGGHVLSHDACDVT